jgi:hypothetical protein
VKSWAVNRRGTERIQPNSRILRKIVRFITMKNHCLPPLPFDRAALTGAA